MTACRGIHRPDGPLTLEWIQSQAERVGECLVWQRSKTRDGYGKVAVAGKEVGAHRIAYELAKGPVPCWLVLDHLCRTRACVNPDHLEPVTQAENTRRGASPSTVAHRTGRCSLGHALTASGGRMRCRTCLKARQREWYERKLAKDASLPAPASTEAAS